MTTPTKRSVGRPRKNAKKQENPDCEVASKGYVKCLMRKALGHHHFQNVPFGVTAFAVIMGGLFTMCLSIGEGYWVTLSPQWFAPMLMFTLACLVVMIDLMRGDAEHVCNNTVSSITAIQKHEEPPCEPKRECEE